MAVREHVPSVKPGGRGLLVFEVKTLRGVSGDE